MQRFNIFRDQNIALAKSLIFKSDIIAQQMNLAITENGGTVLSDRFTWRYYQHLAGIRHETDKPLLIRSLDTKKDIELTPANMALHKKTSNAYRGDPDTYIDGLIGTYPDYAVYIRGVFNPVPLSVSVPARECSILYYNKSLVEPQETSLITRMEEWIYAVHVRWMAEGWRVHNDAFVLAFYLKLFPRLGAELMDRRLEKIHTVETHSFHVTEFLASHQELHEFVPYLTNKMKFTLYRNIRFWERNSGKSTIFDWMVDTLFTGWSMPAVSYTVSQKIHDPTTGSDDDVNPLPIAYSKSLNYEERDSGRDLNLLSTNDVIQKEYGLAYDNAEYQQEYQDDLDSRLGLTLYAAQPTKLVEVTSIDPEAIERWEFTHLLFNEWLHYTARGTYNIMHEVLNPTTGDTIKISTKELLALYLYAGFKGFSGVALEKIPDFNAMGVLIKRWVSVEEMHNYLIPSWPGRYDRMVSYFADTHYEQLTPIENAEEMYSVAQTIMQNKRRRWVFAGNRKVLTENAAGKLLFQYFYRDYKCPLNLNYKSYDEFFKIYNIDYTLISQETWQDIAKDAFNLGTAFESSASISQAEIQRAMVKLISKLASYTVHFAARMSSDTFDVTDPITPLIDDMLLAGSGTIDVDHTPATVVSVKSKSRAHCDTVLDVTPSIKTSVPTRIRATMNVFMGIQVSTKSSIRVNIEQPPLEVTDAEWESGEKTLTRRVRHRDLPGFTTDNLE
ncbi:putative virion structural protein [Erwinia phage vB_EamM_Kwan]|uniref:Putative virion structural protein n=1 Tax=Erwinia phage vB_EamM_Kwan TaxID=1883374 RepID=A0A1B2IDW9_9CAUD|nr:putative virion structural protein [Erwinia phage vB_EamM_Kwan]ANZ49453.1 putative virion structural protein [Erwinia phage vB_EamM_Kwan]